MSNSSNRDTARITVAAAVAMAIAASALHAQQAPSAAASDAAASAASAAPQGQLLAAAATATTQAQAMQQVIVTGTRQSGLEAAQSAAPIQVISPQALQTVNAGGSLASTLAQIVPSFTMQAFGFDMGGQTLQATLRGLSPNDVLVLVDGKRRDTTANLAVDGGTIYQGGAATDLGFIPAEAIDHVEVLTEGAAAQYGSDAIAGVINIILKNNSSGGMVTGTYGGYMDGGGVNGDVAGNIGFAPIPGAFVNITLKDANHGHSDRGGIYAPVVQSIGTYPNSNMTQVPGYPYLNKIFGDAETHTKEIVVNSGFPIGGTAEFYAFGTYGDKRAASFENYRTPNRISYTDPTTGVTTYPKPFGFDPQEATHEIDYQMNGGVQGVTDNWNWDFGTGYGEDHVLLYTLDSIGNSYVANGLPTTSNFYDGLLQTTQWSTTLDVNRNFNVGWAGPLNLAWGLEYRRETYKIGAGIPISYIDGGAQSFPGFTPTDAGIHSRKNEAVYIDLAARPIQPLRLDIAGRYENYSDFGSVAIGKLTGRWNFSPKFALRGTVSNGFRAPTLAEAYYTSTNVGPTSAFVQLPPDSAAGKILGLGNGLTPEKSLTYSLGMVWRPIPRIITTLDFYQVTITNRIVGSGSIFGQIRGNPPTGQAPADTTVINNAIAATGSQLDPRVVATGTTGINVFSNGIDTRTDGLDLAFNMPSDYSFGHVDWSVSGTYAKTVLANTPPPLPAIPDVPLYSVDAISTLTTASPRYEVNLGARWTHGKATIDLTERVYGPAYELANDGGNNPTGRPEYFRNTIGVSPLTNIDLAYRFTPHLRVNVGAQNLFDRYPNKVNATILAHDWAYGQGVTIQYPLFSPYGINGGYWYAKATYSF